MLIETNIPVYEITHPSFIAFIEKYTKQAIPSDTTIRTNYLPVLYNLAIKILCAKVAGKKIWVSVDKKTNANIATWPISYLVYWTMKTSAANRTS